MAIELTKWEDAQDNTVRLDHSGCIIDYLDSDKKREDTPEERTRQKTVHTLVKELGYQKNRIGLERTIKIGREKKRADIVIYNNKDAQVENDQKKIHLIIETKAPKEKNPDGQLISYISATSASGGYWTNGNLIKYYRKDPKKFEVQEWIGVPKSGATWDSIGKFKKKDLISPVNLKIAFKRCHNAIYKAGIDSEDIALDIVRIILAKVEDESGSSEDCSFYITPTEFQTAKLRKQACDRIRTLFNSVKTRFPDVFNKHESITSSDAQLSIVISFLQQYSFLEAPYDVIGTAYETYVASHLKGERGQFFTNRLVVNMMVKMLDPNDKDVVLDPCCGSGGFLISSMNYLFNKIDQSSRNNAAKDLLKRNVCGNLFGVDTAPKLVKVAKANMLLARDGHTGMIRANGLLDLSELPDEFSKKAGKNRPTLILTNPPFGSGHDLREKHQEILKQFKVGHVWTRGEGGKISFSEELLTKQGVAPEILFIERCIEWLKEGGRIGIVMAKGQLDNKEAYAIRDYILKKCKILGVINLHGDTFEPFCGSKASVLFLQKLKKNEKIDNYKIFMAISNKIGQTSRGEPIFKRDSEGSIIVKNDNLVLDHDLDEIAEDYQNFLDNKLEESPFRFSITYDDIRNDSLSLNPVQYLPHHNTTLQKILSLPEDKFEIVRLREIADVYNGPRFKRPYADLGVTEGPTIKKYFTGTALTQLNSDNIKYLDTRKANKQQLKHLEKLTIEEGFLLISDSGTLGRVTYALKQHHGHLATNNLIRIVIAAKNLRGYIYQFLQSDVGQSLMLKNAYGTNQEHLEPEVLADMPVPIPKNKRTLNTIGKRVIDSIDELEKSLSSGRKASNLFSNMLAGLS